MLLGLDAGVELVGAAVTPEELLALCDQECPDVVALDVDAEGRDAIRLATTLRKRHGQIRLVGLYASVPLHTARNTRRAGVRALVPRHTGFEPILRAVRAEPEQPVGFLVSQREGDGNEPFGSSESLTSREIDVLELISTGRTTHQISGDLEISPKTVENHKQRTFRKLGVQNQSHAVAIALRQGIILSGGPDGIIDLTAEG